MRQKNFRLRLHLRGEEGQAIVEYALILALITVVAVGTLTAVGEQVAFSLLDTVAQRLADVLAGL
jgi:Flp pilus assembly pilin Flp